MNTETRVGLFIILGVGIFLYLSIHIGDIKLNRNEYSLYSAYFDETGGIEGKSPVKMAGVSVGWVDAINLLPGGKAEIKMRVKSIHKLGKNAFARISQEGLIGTKTIEIDPGDSSSGYLAPGSILPMPGRAPTTVNGLLEHFKDISTNIGDVTSSMKNMLATAEAEGRIKDTLHNAHQTSKNVSSITSHTNDLITVQKENIKNSIENIKAATDALKKELPAITSNAKDALKSADEMLDKINNGDGLVSKLLNEEQLYTDVHKTIQGVRGYVDKTQSIKIKLDGHLERMLDDSDRKGYAVANIYTYSDYFYSIGVTNGKVGKFERQTTYNKYYDSDNKEIILPTYAQLPNYPGTSPLTLAAYAAKTVQIKSTPTRSALNAQIGRQFTNLIIRGGIFEDQFGIGIDYHIPLGSSRFSWTTTVEAFDFNGHNRANGDGRPHVKWLNKVSYLKTLYATFGIDDMFSTGSFSPFIGFGISFDDDDLKYFLPSLAALK